MPRLSGGLAAPDNSLVLFNYIDYEPGEVS